MATYYFRSTGTTWGTAGSWSSTPSPGYTAGAVPTVADDAVFESASASCNINTGATRTCKSLTCTGYTGTLTFSTSLVVAGNITLSSGMTTTGVGNLDVSANATLTAAGHTLNVNLRFTTINTTIQIADTWVLAKGLSALGTPSGSIAMQSSAPGVQRTFTLLNNGITDQDIDYLNVTDIDGSAGLTVWTYKGNPPSNSQNWFVMTTQPPPVSSVSIG